MASEIFEKIKQVIIDRYGENDHLTEDSPLSDIDGWDSLSNVMLVRDLETAFGINFSFDEIFAFEKLGEFVECIEEKLN